MKTHLLILFLILFAFMALPASAQNEATSLALPDSLVGKLKENRQNDDVRGKALADIIEYLFEHRQHEAALPYIKELRNLKYYNEGDYYQVALCDYYYGSSLLTISKTNNNVSGFQEAMLWLDKALVSLDKTIDNILTRKLKARVMLGKSSGLFSMNLYPQMYECTINGIEIAEIDKDSLMIGKLYNYPNPFTNEVRINAAEAINGSASISVFNVLGEQVISKAMQCNGTTEFVIDGSSLNAGIYFYSIATENGKLQGRIVKE